MRFRKSRLLLALLIQAQIGWAQEPEATPGASPSALVNPSPAPPAPSPAPRWSEAQEQLFQRELKKKFKPKAKSHDGEVLMRVYFEDQDVLLTTMATKPGKEGQLNLERLALLSLLSELVVREWFEKPEVKKILSANETTPFIDYKIFDNTGVYLKYDEATLELRLFIPAELRSAKTASLTRQRDLSHLENGDPPSLLSGYLNINAGEVFDSRLRSSDSRNPVKAQLDSSLNIGSFVLEGYGTYTENKGQLTEGDRSFVRQDVRLVKDIQSIAMRTMAGDLVYPVQTFQSYRPMGGVAVSSQYSMRPSLLTYPSGTYEVFLKTPSKVFVYVNDNLQQVLDLPAGKHLLKDFPFAMGLNDVRLEIIDDVGRTETLNYSYFSNSELLDSGLSQYSYAVGAPSVDPARTGQGDRSYDSARMTMSAFHRVGLSETFTMGAAYQSDNKQKVASLSGLLSTPLGYFKLEPGYSSNPFGETGYALAGRYYYVDYKGREKSQRSYSLGALYHTPEFMTLGQTGRPSTIYELTVGYTQGLTRQLSLTTQATFRGNRKTNPDIHDSFTLSLGLNKRWSNGLTSNFTATHNKQPNGNEDLSFVFFLVWYFPKDHQVITALHNTQSHATRADWNYQPSGGAQSTALQATIKDGEQERGYLGQVNYNGNRTRTTVSHEVLLSKDPNFVSKSQTQTPSTATPLPENKNSSNHVTSLQLGTSLVFAGGTFAISRPIPDSFAIVKPVKGLKGQRLELNRQSDGTYLAASDWMGPAVASELGSYNYTTLTVAGRDFKQGMILPKDHMNLYPTYKSGYAYLIGTDATIYLSINLLQSDRKPLATAAGQITYLDDKDEPPISVFTNRKGQLRSEGFKPGRYLLEIALDEFEPFEFTVPEIKEYEYDLGTIILKAKPK